MKVITNITLNQWVKITPLALKVLSDRAKHNSIRDNDFLSFYSAPYYNNLKDYLDARANFPAYSIFVTSCRKDLQKSFHLN